MATEAFSGKAVIITGASSGIGRATAVMFARGGAMVTLCGRDEHRLKEAHGQCTEVSGGHEDRFITVQGDITDAKIRENIVAKTVEKFGRLDILVPNAGGNYTNKDISQATELEFDFIFDINVKSVFFLIQAALPHLENFKGNVVSTSSLLGQTAVRKFVIYAMSKAALDHMTRCLALDLAPKGIRVNAVNPSYVETRAVQALTNDPEIQLQILKHEQSMQPTGECGTVDDMAQAICHLASDTAKFITGQCLTVDGGRGMTGPGP